MWRNYDCTIMGELIAGFASVLAATYAETAGSTASRPLRVSY